MNRLLEGEPAPTIFASRLGDFVVVGDTVHYLLVIDTIRPDGIIDQVVVCRLLMPLSGALAGNQMAKEALSGTQPMEVRATGHVRSGKH